MRKNMAKMAAALLSAALVVTSVNIPGTTSEAATAKISVAKKTLYAGGPSSRKVVTLAVKKGSKKLTGVTFTSSNKAVASVGKKTGLVTAKKKGTAVITAKVNGKKYTSKITVKKWVYATGFAAGATELTIEEGGSQVLTVAYNGDPTKKAAVFTSSDTSIVKVNKKTKKFKVKLTGEKVGTATITVKPAADVVKKADRAAMTQKVTVNVVPKSEEPSTEPSSEAPASENPASEAPAEDDGREVAKLEAEVTNSITKNKESAHEGTVLTGQDAYVKATALDADGKPVAGKKIVLNMADNTIIGGLRYFMDQNTTVDTTDKNGVATFVLRPQGSVPQTYDGINPNTKEKIKATDRDYIASYDLTLTDAGSNVKSDLLAFKVAALAYRGGAEKHVLDADGKAMDVNTIANTTVSILNGTNFGDKGYKNLVPGVNVNNAKVNLWDDQLGYASNIRNVAGRTGTSGTIVNGPYFSEYVTSQQVSSKEDENDVYVNSDVYLELPGVSDEKQGAKVETDDSVAGKSGTYDLYVDGKDKGLFIPYKVTDFDRVDYATLKFKSLSLSKYTQLKVYAVGKDEKISKVMNKAKTTTYGDSEIIKTYGDAVSNVDLTNFGLQISVNELKGINGGKVDEGGNAKGLYLELESAGKVDQNCHGGYEIESLTYHYKTQSAKEESTFEKLESAEIEWEKVDKENVLQEAETTIYEVENNKVIKNAGTADEITIRDKVLAAAAGLGDADATTVNGTKYTKITYQVPVFPWVGNAIIRVYAGTTIKQYYAASITNNGDNKNVIAPNDNFYLISHDEEKNNANATVTNETGSGLATIHATETGSTYLKGTVTCDDIDLNLDDDNRYVYSFVMFNPVQNAVNKHESFLALKGQGVKLIAQLKDKNTNEAHGGAGRTIVLTNDATKQNAVTVDKWNSITDNEGQASFTITGSANLSHIVDLSASESTNTYNVSLWIDLNADGKIVSTDDVEVSTVDLYWVDAKLRFTDQVQDVQTVTGSNGTAGASVTVKQPVKTTWKYGVEVVPTGSYNNTTKKKSDDYKNNKFKAGQLAGQYVERIVGIVPGFKYGTCTADSISADPADHAAIVKGAGADGGTRANGSITYKINKTDTADSAPTLFEGAGAYLSGDTKTKVPFIGGAAATTIAENLTLNYLVGEEALDVSFPYDTEILGVKVDGNARTTYVLVKDIFTGAPVSGAKVVFTADVNGALATVSAAEAAAANVDQGTAYAADNKVVVTTNAEGVAAVTVSPKKAVAEGKTQDVKLTVDAGLALDATGKAVDKNQIIGTNSKTFTFTNPKVGFAFGTLAIKDISFDAGTITLHFNKAIEPNSVIKEEFKVFYGKDQSAGAGVLTNNTVDKNHANAVDPVTNMNPATGIVSEGMREYTRNISKVEPIDGNTGVKITLLSNPLNGDIDNMLIVQTQAVNNVNGETLKYNTAPKGVKYVTYQITSVDGETLSNGNIAFKRSLTNDPAVTGMDLSTVTAVNWQVAYAAMVANTNAATAKAAQDAYDDLTADEKAYVTSEEKAKLDAATGSRATLATQVAADAAQLAGAIAGTYSTATGKNIPTLTNGSTVTLYKADGTTLANGVAGANGLAIVNSGVQPEFTFKTANVLKGSEYYLAKVTKSGVTTSVAVIAKAAANAGDVKVTTATVQQFINDYVGKLTNASTKDDFDTADALFTIFNGGVASVLDTEITTEQKNKVIAALNEKKVDKVINSIGTALGTTLQTKASTGGTGISTGDVTINGSTLNALLTDLSLTGTNEPLDTTTVVLAGLPTKNTTTDTANAVLVDDLAGGLTFKKAISGTGLQTAAFNYSISSDIATDSNVKVKVGTITVTNGNGAVTISQSIN